MKKLNEKEQMQINGGEAHMHWDCNPCNYHSVARDYKSCSAWQKDHNSRKGHAYMQGALLSDCDFASCGKIYKDMP